MVVTLDVFAGLDERTRVRVRDVRVYGHLVVTDVSAHFGVVGAFVLSWGAVNEFLGGGKCHCTKS